MTVTNRAGGRRSHNSSSLPHLTTSWGCESSIVSVIRAHRPCDRVDRPLESLLRGLSPLIGRDINSMSVEMIVGCPVPSGRPFRTSELNAVSNSCRAKLRILRT